MIIYLQYAQDSSNHDEEIGLVGEGAEAAGDDAEHGVHKQAKGGHSQQDVV